MKKLLVLNFFLIVMIHSKPITYIQLDLDDITGIHTQPMNIIKRHLNIQDPNSIKLISLHCFYDDNSNKYKAIASVMDNGYLKLYEYSIVVGTYMLVMASILDKKPIDKFKLVSLNTHLYLSLQLLIEDYYLKERAQLQYLHYLYQNDRLYIAQTILTNKTKDMVIIYINDNNSIRLSAVYHL